VETLFALACPMASPTLSSTWSSRATTSRSAHQLAREAGGNGQLGLAADEGRVAPFVGAENGNPCAMKILWFPQSGIIGSPAPAALSVWSVRRKDGSPPSGSAPPLRSLRLHRVPMPGPTSRCPLSPATPEPQPCACAVMRSALCNRRAKFGDSVKHYLLGNCFVNLLRS